MSENALKVKLVILYKLYFPLTYNSENCKKASSKVDETDSHLTGLFFQLYAVSRI